LRLSDEVLGRLARHDDHSASVRAVWVQCEYPQPLAEPGADSGGEVPEYATVLQGIPGLLAGFRQGAEHRRTFFTAQRMDERFSIRKKTSGMEFHSMPLLL